MPKVIASSSTSVDGYTTGPNDRPGIGLGEGGEPLHFWMFGGPWGYEDESFGEATGVDKEFLDATITPVGAVIGGR